MPHDPHYPYRQPDRQPDSPRDSQPDSQPDSLPDPLFIDRPLADPSQAPPRWASPRSQPLAVRQPMHVYFDLPALGRDLVAATVLRAPEGGPPFVLRSGLLSDAYVDKYAIGTNPYLLDRVAFAMCQLVLDLTGGVRPDCLAGPELGAVPLVTAMSLEVGIPSLIVRKKARIHGPKAMRESPDGELTDAAIAKAMIEGTLLSDALVVVVEDVVTTGFELTRAALILRNAGARLVVGMAVIDREEGGAEAMAQANIPYRPLFTRKGLGF